MLDLKSHLAEYRDDVSMTQNPANFKQISNSKPILPDREEEKKITFFGYNFLTCMGYAPDKWKQCISYLHIIQTQTWKVNLNFQRMGPDEFTH